MEEGQTKFLLSSSFFAMFSLGVGGEKGKGELRGRIVFVFVLGL